MQRGFLDTFKRPSEKGLKRKKKKQCILFQNIQEQNKNLGKRRKARTKNDFFCPNVNHVLRENIITTVQTSVYF